MERMTHSFKRIYQNLKRMNLILLLGLGADSAVILLTLVYNLKLI